MAKFVGDPISERVINQIKVRENTLGRVNGYIENHVRFKAGNNAWIRVISGVDVRDEQDRFTSKSARNYVLSGGELVWDGKKFLKRSAFNTGPSNERGRYNYTNVYGIRPEGGITGFSIKHKNRFGTVREAIINFTVWSVDDLEIAENLYFRPGMTVITEWGNSSYITNDNNFVDIVTTEGVDKFFKEIKIKSPENNNQNEILAILERNIENSDYNYDAFFGFVSNFSWSIREDGGYDCSIRVLSRGAILESLTTLKGTEVANNGPFASIEEKFFSKAKVEPEEEPDTTNDDPSFLEKVGRVAKGVVEALDDLFEGIGNRFTYADTEVEQNQRLSLLHFFCYKVEEIAIEDLDEQVINYDNFLSPVYYVDAQGNTTGETANPTRAKGVPVPKEVNPLVNLLKKELGSDPNDFIVAGFDGRSQGDGATAFRYISLRTFLALINLSFLNSSEDESLPSFSLDVNKYGKYATFANHFSFDPSKVLLPKIPSQGELKASKAALKNLLENDTFNEKRYEDRVPYVQVVLNDTTHFIRRSTAIRQRTTSIFGDPVIGYADTNILNIFISTKLIIDGLNNLYSIETAPENIDLQTFIRGILNEINSNLGGINDLDITYDELTNKLLITDRALVSGDLKPAEVPIIKLTGLSTTVKNISLETKISSQLASQISISATAGAGGDISSNPGLINYNDGKRDRFRVNYKQFTEEEESSIKKSNEENNKFYQDLEAENAKQQQENAELEAKQQADEKEKRGKFFLNTLNAYSIFNNTKADLRMQGVYKKRFFNKIKGEAISRTKKAYLGEREEKNETAPAIIPIELSITLNGISGLKVGQIFKLGDDNNPSPILPKIYQKTGFIITGLDSTLEGDKWFTTVRGQTFMLERISESKATGGGIY